jgi:hypothetical protein
MTTTTALDFFPGRHDRQTILADDRDEARNLLEVLTASGGRP